MANDLIEFAEDVAYQFGFTIPRNARELQPYGRA